MECINVRRGRIGVGIRRRDRIGIVRRDGIGIRRRDRIGIVRMDRIGIRRMGRIGIGRSDLIVGIRDGISDGIVVVVRVGNGNIKFASVIGMEYNLRQSEIFIRD